MDDKIQQTEHAKQMRAERRLTDNLGVTRSDARKALQQFAKEDRLTRLSAIGVEQNKLRNEPIKLDAGQPQKLDLKPLPVAAPQAGAAGPTPLAASFGTEMQIDFVAIGGLLKSIIVKAVIVEP